MSRECVLCGKTTQSGHNVSHSNNKTNRTFKPNLQLVNMINGGVKSKALVCTRCIRSGKVVKPVAYKPAATPKTV